MKMTLIEIVQEIMDAIDGDYVNSFSDTDESMQVASIVRSSFYDIIYRKQWPHLRKIGTLESVNDSRYPTHLKLPPRVMELEDMRYDKARVNETRLMMERCHYKEPEEFLRLLAGNNTDTDNVTEYQTTTGVRIALLTDRAPIHYTSFDDEYIVFDAFDSEKESTLRGDNTQAIYFESPEFLLQDNFVADLPNSEFRGFVEEAKSAASLRVRQVADQKAEQSAKRHSVRSAQRARKVARGNRYPDYGRKGSKGTTSYTGSSKRDKWAV